jgi:hypothetical protein
MHPEIEKFWNDAGYEVELIHTDDVDIYTSKSRIASPLCHVYKDGRPSIYWLRDWDRQLFTESQMLRIIKLKAFL